VRRSFALPAALAVSVALAGVLGTSLLPVGAETSDAATGTKAAMGTKASAVVRRSLHVGETLAHAQRLVSSSGRYVATVDRRGRVVVRTAAGAVRWRSPAAGAGAKLVVGRTGLLALRVGAHRRWTTRTAGSGHNDVLTMRNDGVLALTAGGLTVWSTRLPYACPSTRRNVIVVDLSRQWARVCHGRQQIRATLVTTGARALGRATPTGTWRVNSFKRRNATLRPATGGSYRVRYWLPYDGTTYGLHDASWQRIPYGSARYRTHGSHGCVHVPLLMMRWIYGWAAPGTRVTIHA